jgi:hypothetical protein
MVLSAVRVSRDRLSITPRQYSYMPRISVSVTMWSVAHLASVELADGAVLGLRLEGLLRKLDHLAVVGAHETGRAEQVGLAQAARVISSLSSAKPKCVQTKSKAPDRGLDVARGQLN